MSDGVCPQRLKPDLDKAPGPNGPAMKYTSTMVICGNRQPWEQDESNSTNNIDAPLLRWMLSAFFPQIWLAVKAVYGLRAAPRLCDKRSDEQVSKWTEAKPVGVVGLYVDDTLAGATN
eukprot:4141196-Amphidinium_carterae.1